jgi:hypothetical protein
MNRKINFIIEMIWLGLFFGCIIMGVIKTIQHGLNHSYMFFILAVIAFIMYSIRRTVRKSQKKRG